MQHLVWQHAFWQHVLQAGWQHVVALAPQLEPQHPEPAEADCEHDSANNAAAEIPKMNENCRIASP
ncbi:MAG TPA: hypothetical protein VF278_18210 [Pirellulales bacterium]